MGCAVPMRRDCRESEGIPSLRLPGRDWVLASTNNRTHLVAGRSWVGMLSEGRERLARLRAALALRRRRSG